MNDLKKIGDETMLLLALKLVKDVYEYLLKKADEMSNRHKDKDIF